MSFPNDKILDYSKSKAFADNKIVCDSYNVSCFLAFFQTTNSGLKQFADDKDENGRKFYKQVEKGEIARNEQFLLFPQCFQTNCTADTWKSRVCLGNVQGVKERNWRGERNFVVADIFFF